MRVLDVCVRWAGSPICCWLVLLGLGSWPVAGVTSELFPHVAQYRLSLLPREGQSGISAIKGRMQIQVEASCHGWTVHQFVAFHLLAEDGSSLEHLARLQSFERRDGDEFIFSAETWEDRDLVEHLTGRAQRERDGAVVVNQVLPTKLQRELPRGVLFPSRYMLTIIDSARAGERSLRRVVFDGTTEDNPYEVAASIARAEANANLEQRLAAQLDGHAMWSVRLAYFRPLAVEPQAEFEMSVELYDHGIAGDMVFDYTDFAMAVTLQELTVSTPPQC